MASSPQVQLYDAVEKALNALECDIGASECHGILCGMLCSPNEFDPSIWVQHTTGQNDLCVISDEDADHALWVLLRETVNNFDPEELSLEIMLPDDDDLLGQRATALGAWCRGFLSGFGLTGLTDLEQLSTDSREFLKDLREVGRVDANDAEGETDERALFEITEYVRVGVLLVREETRFILSGGNAEDIVH